MLPFADGFYAAALIKTGALLEILKNFYVNLTLFVGSIAPCDLAHAPAMLLAVFTGQPGAASLVIPPVLKVRTESHGIAFPISAAARTMARRVFA